MNRYFLLLLGFCAIVCNTVLAQQKETATISGRVGSSWPKTVKLSTGAIRLVDPWIDRLNPGDTIINLDDKGSFRIELPMGKADFYSIAHGAKQIELFIKPNDSLFIDFESDKPITGTSEALNGHLRSLRAMINTNRKFINGSDFYQQTTERVTTILDSLEQVYFDYHRKFAETNLVPSAFEQKINTDITYRSKLCKLAHPAVHMQQTGKALGVPLDYFKALAQGSFTDPEQLKSLDYVLFINDYVVLESTGDYKFGVYWEAPIERIHPKYQQIQNLEAHSAIKDYLFHDHLNKSMDSYGVAYLKDLIPQFKKDCKDPILVKQVDNRFKKGMERRQEPDEIKIFKQMGNVALEAHIFYPEGFKVGDERPAYLFFHGGGWAIGIPEWGYKKCKKYRNQGMVAVSFEYRLIDIHRSNILNCIADAKSAIRWTRAQAKNLGVDPDKIVAAGFSAGAHLSACTAIIKGLEESQNHTFSSKPNAIVVQSASYNTTKSKWFAKQSNQQPESISTFHQLDKNLVPALFFHGTEDHLAPISEFTEFKDKMDALGHSYDFKIFENVGHFFNDPEANKTVDEMTEAFFRKLGYLN